jgi:hypothetical protein
VEARVFFITFTELPTHVALWALVMWLNQAIKREGLH